MLTMAGVTGTPYSAAMAALADAAPYEGCRAACHAQCAVILWCLHRCVRLIVDLCIGL
jgi:hypothetical protein